MVLDAEDGQLAVAQALNRAVVQVHVRDLRSRLRRGNRVGHDLELVVLGGDGDVAAAQVAHGVVAA